MFYCKISSPQTAYVYDANADKKIVGIFSAYDAKKVVALLNAERQRTAPVKEPLVLFPHVYKRTWRDVVGRYIRRFGGSTFTVQTDADDAEVYLCNRIGTPIATVSPLNRFPEKVDTAVFEDMPF